MELLLALARWTGNSSQHKKSGHVAALRKMVTDVITESKGGQSADPSTSKVAGSWTKYHQVDSELLLAKAR
jgi:hypothetical protein